MRIKQKILTLSKSRILTLGFAIFFNIALAGSVCGTFAWYSYATRVGFAEKYSGTTASLTSGYLRIGLLSNHYLFEYNKYNLEIDNSIYNDSGKFIYWCKDNRLQSNAINYVVDSNGYGTTSIEPTTTGSNNSIAQYGYHLYRKPTHHNNYQLNPSNYASEKSYVKIPFIFSIVQDNGERIGTNIFLSNAVLSTSNDDLDGGEVHKAVRMLISNKNGTYLCNPSSEKDGTNIVGGILDLDLNGFYDYDYNTNKEIVYGEFSGSYEYEENPTAVDGTLSEEERTSFISNHQHGIYAVKEETLTPRIVSFLGTSHFYGGQIPVAVIDSHYGELSVCEITVFMEGWDRHVIDQEQESAFNLELTFSS